MISWPPKEHNNDKLHKRLIVDAVQWILQWFNGLQDSTNNQALVSDGNGSLEFKEVITTEGGQTINGDLSIDGVLRPNNTTVFGSHTYQADNVRSYYGSGNDAYIEHTGGLNQFVNFTGSMIINQQAPSNFMYLSTFDSVSANKEGIIIGGATPTVRLHYDGSEVLETSVRGIDITGVAIGHTSYPWGGANTIGVNIHTDVTPNNATFIDMRRFTGVASNHRSVALGQENNSGQWDFFIYADNLSSNTYAITKKLRVPTASGALVQIADSGGTLRDIIHNGGGQTIESTLALNNTLTISAVNPRVSLYETGAALNEKRWDVSANAGALGFRAYSDDGLTSDTWLYVDRTGTTVNVPKVTNGAGTVYDIIHAGGGQTIDGSLVVTGATTFGTTGDSAASKTTFTNQVLNTANANIDGPNFDVQTTNKNVAEYAYKVTRNGASVGGFLVTGALKCWSGTSLVDAVHTGGGQTIAGTTLSADLVINESADHSETPTAGKGQLWVKNDTPCSLYFTDDAGTDFNLSGSALTYVEGAWTPTLVGSGSNPTQSYNNQTGSYTRIGRVVYFNAYVQMATSGISAGSGTAKIGGLPIAPAGSTLIPVTVGPADNWSTSSKGAPTHAAVQPATSEIVLWTYDNDAGNIGSNSVTDAADIGNQTSVYISGHYEV